MSSAFIKESDVIEVLPERIISPHPNYVTQRGQTQIENEYNRLSGQYAKAQEADDRDTLARVGRDLRYWQQRQATAQLVPPPKNKDEVYFGATVTVDRDDGRRQTWRIVGEDEADPAKGSLSYVSPLARALAGKRVGDVVQVGAAKIEVVAIE
jgi:transcription elongation GreA/GreB family factor